MPFLVGLLRQHLQFVHALNSPMEDGIERVVVYISDQNKDVQVDVSQIDLPLPKFKCKNDTQDLI